MFRRRKAAPSAAETRREPGFEEDVFGAGRAEQPSAGGFSALDEPEAAPGARRTPRGSAAAAADDPRWRAPHPAAAPPREAPAEAETAPPLEETLGLSEGYAKRAEARRAAGLSEEERGYRAVAAGAARIGGGIGWLLGRIFGRRGLSGAAGRAYERARERGWTSGAAPILIGVAIGGGVAAAPPIQEALSESYDRVREAVLARPEYAIRELDVSGAHRVDLEALRQAVLGAADTRAAIAFDYAGARARIEALGWVERASVVLKPPHTLAIDVVEREPAALWRRGRELRLLDPTGVVIDQTRTRAAFPTLPLVVGPGADQEVPEALRLWRVAVDGGLSAAALTRVGGRRWDLELIGGPRLMLPERDPQAALEKASRWARQAGLLQRGFEVVDFRLPYAPTARPAPRERAASIAPGEDRSAAPTTRPL